jgi:glycolate oxidase iron-sulfur subunit
MMHAGVEDEALGLARETIAAYEGFDAIAVNVAGCGSGMKDYAHLLADDPQWAQRAEAFSAKVRDVHELLPGPSRARPPSAAADGRLPTTPATSPTRKASASPPARAVACDPRPRSCRAGRMGAVCCGSAGYLEPHAARGRRAKLGGRARRRTSRATGRAGDRRRQPGSARCRSPRTSSSRCRCCIPMTLLDHSISQTGP